MHACLPASFTSSLILVRLSHAPSAVSQRFPTHNNKLVKISTAISIAIVTYVVMKIIIIIIIIIIIVIIVIYIIRY